MPIIGAHRRNRTLPRIVSAVTTVSVASAVSGAATGSSIDASSRSPKTTDASVMERIIITVPLTTGVTSRRRMNSHLATTNWNAAEASTNVVSVAGPPSTTAVMQNGMAKAAVKNGITAPAPNGPRRRTCTSVERPTASSEAKTIHVTYGSPLSDAFATMTGVTSNVAEAIMLNCRP